MSFNRQRDQWLAPDSLSAARSGPGPKRATMDTHPQIPFADHRPRLPVGVRVVAVAWPYLRGRRDSSHIHLVWVMSIAYRIARRARQTPRFTGCWRLSRCRSQPALIVAVLPVGRRWLGQVTTQLVLGLIGLGLAGNSITRQSWSSARTCLDRLCDRRDVYCCCGLLGTSSGEGRMRPRARRHHWPAPA